MTFQELLDQYIAAGGQSEVGEAGPDMTPITLPDGRVAYRSGYGGLTVMSDITPDGYNMQSYMGDGTPAGGQYMSTPELSAGRSALRALGVLGAPALAVNALPGLLASGAAPAATGGAALVDAAAGTGGMTAAQLGLTGGAAPAAIGGGSALVNAATGAGGMAAAPAVAPEIAALGDGSFMAGAMGPAAAATAPALSSLLSGGGLSSILSNPALWAAGGALAGIAGNGDIRSSQNSASTSNSNANTTGGQAGTGSTTATSGLAPWMQQYAQDYVGQASRLANGPQSNPYLDQAGRMLMGAGSDPMIDAARAQQTNVIGGGMIGKNPYIDQVASNVGRQMGDAYALGTRGNITSAFNASGSDPRFSTAYAQTVGKADENFARGLGDTMASLYGNNYATERAAQDAASRGSLGFGTYGQQAAGNLSAFGQQDWMRPFQANQYLGQALNPAFGSQTASNTASNANSWQNAATNTNSNGTQSQTVNAPNNWMAGAGGAALGASLWRQLMGMK